MTGTEPTQDSAADPQQVARSGFQLLRLRPGFRRLWLANAISQLGDWVGWVAVSFMVARSDGPVLALATVFLAHHLPSSLFAPIGGMLADRMSRRRLMMLSLLAQSAATVGMLAAASSGHLRLLELLLVLRSAMVAVFGPAERAAVPRLVADKELLLAGSFDSATWSVMFSLGMAAGGLLTSLGVQTALALDAASFIVAAVLIRGLPALVPEPAPEACDPETDENCRGSDTDGSSTLSWLWQRPRLLLAAVAKSPMALASGSAWVILNVTVTRGEAGAAALGLGGLLALRGIGTGVGPLAYTRLRGLLGLGEVPSLRIWTALMLGTLVTMAGFIATASAGLWWAAAAVTLVWGMGGGSNWVISTAEIQRRAPDHRQGRVHALDNASWVACQSLAVTLTAWLLDLGATELDASWPLLAVAALAWLVLLSIQLRPSSRVEPAATM